VTHYQVKLNKKTESTPAQFFVGGVTSDSSNQETVAYKRNGQIPN